MPPTKKPPPIVSTRGRNIFSKTFPVDILRIILLHLQFKDLVRLGIVDKYFRNLVSETWPFLFENRWPQYVSVINSYKVENCELEWSSMYFDFSNFNFTNSITNTMRLSCPICGSDMNQRLSDSSLERVCLRCPFQANCGPYIVQENDCYDLKSESTVLVMGACYECGSVRCEECVLSCSSADCSCESKF